MVDGFDADAKPIHFIMRIHEGVLNPSSPTMLILENQVCENVHIVDLVHKQHMKDLDGKKGTQQIILCTPDLGFFFVPLVQWGGGLMTFSHAISNKEDYASLPLVELTLDNRWAPNGMNDDADINIIQSCKIEKEVEGKKIKKIIMSKMEKADFRDIPLSILCILHEPENPDEIKIEEFYDCKNPDDEYLWYIGENFVGKVNREIVEQDRFYKMSNTMDKKSIYRKSFHLTLNMERECFVCYC